ncbi:hypothetical protein OCK74_22250 [Chitinophagaceae bacterium LB-8]|uniref:Uncharacterized protein n=1 Tax=Paraflavisolibacter caeni TaxID=2982496 RepID=A0A9X3BJZ2_9BACT|nr:hypothetical protein [Paraflavisolibacter caeni]MCU7551858.1 hypothetical protein [Paraflavisolibacter caeni]
MINKVTGLLAYFSKLVLENNISLSCQEVLNDCIIGIDGIHRKILVVKQTHTSYYQWRMIDFDEIMNCSVKKTYSSIKAGELKERTIEAYLEQIDLRLELLNKKEPVEIPFYKQNNKGLQVPELDRKAKNWQIMLSKMSRRQLKSIA